MNSLIALPNIISLFRMFLVLPACLNIIDYNFGTALLFFCLAAISDALDGFLARYLNLQTNLGKILDPVADKLLLGGAIGCLWFISEIPLYVFTIFITRDLLILLGATYEISSTDRTPTPNLFGKFTTICQMILIISIMINAAFSGNFNFLIAHIIVCSVTIISLSNYFGFWIYNNFIIKND